MKERNDMELKFDITEEQVQAAVKAVVREEMAAMNDDWGGVRGLVKKEMERVIAKLVADEAGDRFDEIAKQVVEEHVSEPFELDSGWGYERKKFDTYGDFIRYKLAEKFRKDEWSVKRKFEELMQTKVDKAWNEYKVDAIATAMAKVEAMKAVE